MRVVNVTLQKTLTKAHVSLSLPGEHIRLWAGSLVPPLPPHFTPPPAPPPACSGPPLCLTPSSCPPLPPSRLLNSAFLLYLPVALVIGNIKGLPPALIWKPNRTASST